MKKSLALILGLCIFLSACTAGNGSETIGDPTTTPPTSSQTTATTAPAETGDADETVDPSRPDGMQPSDTSEPTEATQPSGTAPIDKEDTPPKQTEPKETDHTINTSQPTTPTETLPEETVPPVTQPPNTDPTTPQETDPVPPAETKPDDSDNPPENVDASVIAANANSYAVSLGFVIDGSLNKGNSGYYSPDYRPIKSNDAGISAAKDLVAATKNQLNSRFAEDFSPTLVESIYGLVRVNCVVEYSHTDELGNWYYIYVFYG